MNHHSVVFDTPDCYWVAVSVPRVPGGVQAALGLAYETADRIANQATAAAAPAPAPADPAPDVLADDQQDQKGTDDSGAPAPAAQVPTAAPTDPRIRSPRNTWPQPTFMDVVYLLEHCNVEVKRRMQHMYDSDDLAKMKNYGLLLDAFADPEGKAKWELTAPTSHTFTFWGPRVLLNEYEKDLERVDEWTMANKCAMQTLCRELGLDPDWVASLVKLDGDQDNAIYLRLILEGVAGFAKHGIQVIFGYNCEE